MMKRVALISITLLGIDAINVEKPKVEIGNTTLVGTWKEEDIAFFGNIPFAEPPIGNYRFAQAKEKSELPHGEFNATTYGNECMQLTASGQVIGSEDCLTLNVVVPATILAQKKKTSKVVVWIHGGGLVEGAASRYSLLDFCRRGSFIGVSIQYRLNVLGFLSLHGGDKNVGLSDQVLALRWIQKNIHNFGGNRAQVTIFGQSAGASSVLWLAAQPQNLFQKAIAQSPWSTGQSLGGIGLEKALDDIWMGCYCLDAIICADDVDDQDLLSLLRTVDAQRLIQMCGEKVAVIDRPLLNNLCRREPNTISSSVELLVGSNTDEAHLFLLAYENATSKDKLLRDFDLEVREYLNSVYINVDLDITWFDKECSQQAVDFLISHISRAYHGDTNNFFLVDFETDLYFSTITELASASPKETKSNYRYLFEQPIQATNTTVPVGTCHCAELPYTLGFDGFDWDHDTTDEIKIADYFANPTLQMRQIHTDIQQLWIDFVAGNNQQFIATNHISSFGSPYSHLANGTISRVHGDSPVHTYQGQLLSHSFFCDRTYWRNLLAHHGFHIWDCPPPLEENFSFSRSPGDIPRDRRSPS